MFLTFVAYYVVSIIVAFYLYPTQVLIKVVFLKAVAVCAVLNVALLFSNSKFKCGYTWKSFKHDLGYCVRVFAIAMFLPILAFLAFLIGGIIFSGPGQVSGLQGFLTLLPSLFLVFAAWFTKGTLFPAGAEDAADLGSDLINDLENGGKAHSTSSTAAGKAPSPNHTTKSGELSYYNSLNTHTHTVPTDDSGQQVEGGTNDERKPLLH